ncbi:YkgJ family cysteine cluster protein [bacterium]|nr:YkgJ family cysteine cluster protein [bacterium]MBP9808323.1 YkgJ family cysteine cluster protein [bacterium]
MFNAAIDQAQINRLHIPAGIRFECTRCANCCLSWPVPLNEQDVKRLASALHCSEAELPVSFLSPAQRQAGLVGFSRALEKRSDGRCSYLNDFACTLQDVAKPGMCQLFPYSFLDTPEGTFVGLSFASTGVLQNSGRLLEEQSDQLLVVLKLFRELFPNLQDETIKGFEHLQLIDGVTLTYEQFQIIEAPFLSDLAANLSLPGLSVLSLLGRFHQTIAQLVPKERWLRRLPGTDARPRQVDMYILDSLAQAYFNPQSKGSLLDEREIALSVSSKFREPPVGFRLPLNGSSYSAVQFLENKLGDLDDACENLLLRFVYVRVFSKMYFGPGFSALSLIAGLGHLTTILVLIRLFAKVRKMDFRQNGLEETPEELLSWLTEILRQIDSKLSSARYGANTRAMIEFVFLEQERIQRLIDLAA